jgi:predicted patatin/cPLA2 family phospholipase
MRYLIATLTLALACAAAIAANTDIGDTDSSQGQPRHIRCKAKNPMLVTGGGGVRGAFQAGAAWYLIRARGCMFQHYVGTSTGAITAALLAQSRDQDELDKNVDELVQSYLDLRTRDDIVQELPFGKIRMMLPRWLGGVDGMYTLRPTIERLTKQLNVARLSTDNLSITVTSLQSGPLPPHQVPDQLFDQIIGSASLPLAIQPRTARVWTGGRLHAFDGNVMHIRTLGAPGLPDDNCQAYVRGAGFFRCKVIAADGQFDLEQGPLTSPVRTRSVWNIQLRAENMPDEVKAAIQGMTIASDRMEGVGITFTTLHQLVDGGVAEHLPIQRALDIWKSKKTEEQGDTIFVLSTGRDAIADSPNQVIRGGLSIAANSFERLWETYQNTAIQNAEASLYYEKSERKVNVPRVIVIRPLRRYFSETLDVDRRKIREAIYDGCVAAGITWLHSEAFPEKLFFQTFSGLQITQEVLSLMRHSCGERLLGPGWDIS